MGILKAITNSVGGTFADQYKDLITADQFTERSVVVPGILKSMNRGRGANTNGSEGVISNGSIIFVPENTAAFIFSQSGIENIITTTGGYEYQDGEESLFNGDGIKNSIFKQAIDRVGYGGISSMQKQIAFVNLREIRDIKFGTRGPQVYNDMFYGCDLEVYAYGSFTIKVVNPEVFIRNFVPANTVYYSFDNEKVREQIVSEFIQSFITALNSLSTTYRISQLPSQATELSKRIATDSFNAGTWGERFGFDIVQVAVENIEFSDESRELVRQYSANKMNMLAYEGISQKSSNIVAQQKIAEGIQEHGFGDAPGMMLGMGMVQNLTPQAENKSTVSSISMDDAVESLKKMKELLDMGILTQEEFDNKKRELLGL